MEKLFKNSQPYAVVELTKVAAVLTGRMEAQKPLVGVDAVENGTLLEVTKDGIQLPTSLTGRIGIHWSEEQLYEDYQGRGDFRLEAPKQPRVFYLEVGDRLETNAVLAGAFLDVADAKENAVYGVPTIGEEAGGYITLVDDLIDMDDYSTVLEIVSFITLPNGEKGIKFEVAKGGNQ